MKGDVIATRTLGAQVAEATGELARAGIGSPRHDAERLAAHALGVRWGDLWIRIDLPLADAIADRFVGLVGRRASGEPLAYIVGTTVFYGLELACGPGVLVPRPETETLVDVALELIEHRHAPVVIDIGCGSGAIALAVATKREDARVFATDISDDALSYARANARSVAAPVQFRLGDLYEALDAALRGRVDLIVSNPPYVPSGALLPADVRAEPARATLAGPRGDEVLRRIVIEAPAWLRAGGAIALEIGEPWQAEVFPDANVRADLTGRPRVAWVRT